MNPIERINLLKEHLGKTVDGLATDTGIGASRWKNIFSGKAKVRLEDIEALGKAYPEYSHWLAFGKELPESGQISPMTKMTMKTHK